MASASHPFEESNFIFPPHNEQCVPLQPGLHVHFPVDLSQFPLPQVGGHGLTSLGNVAIDSVSSIALRIAAGIARESPDPPFKDSVRGPVYPPPVSGRFPSSSSSIMMLPFPVPSLLPAPAPHAESCNVASRDDITNTHTINKIADVHLTLSLFI